LLIRRPSGLGIERLMPSRVKPARSSTQSKGVLGKRARHLRRDAAAAGAREEPVADLDDPALGVEVVKGAPAENLTGSGLSHEERGEAAARDQLADLREELD